MAATSSRISPLKRRHECVVHVHFFSISSSDQTDAYQVCRIPSRKLSSLVTTQSKSCRTRIIFHMLYDKSVSG